jgi:hypothetical protein
MQIEGQDIAMSNCRNAARTWNDLRYLLATKRGATITAAARLLSVDDTTIPDALLLYGLRQARHYSPGSPTGE